MQSTTASQGRKMPTWLPPAPLDGKAGLTAFWDRFFPLRVSNSLTRTKAPFVPRDPSKVTWYMCGPTVYDASHLGHARTYLCFDILRRIMEDFFGYNVVLIMNVTDIDDKIIMRANENGVDFRSLASQHEASFMDDMKSLGVKQPDHITRVSEFIPEVIEYIEKIIANGFAYESNGSVYFSVDVFHDDPRHAYSKLVPESRGNAELLADGEGALSVGQSDKRSPSDFALWKKSKEGEPSWDSPWGTGRPGWHIECSVMASKTLEHYGDGCMDIHSGGVDLRFPHHDNEIAQSEAHYNCGQWVNYFLHTGHLHIQGFKMSKSLKNFITIRQALETHSPRQIRILFLLHKYNEGMDYGDNTMSNALVLEKTFIEFFHLVKGTLRSSTPLDSLKYGEEEWTLSAALESAKSAVTGALCDDFDTPSAMKALRELIKATNKYVQAKDEAKQKCVITVVRSAGAYVTKVLRIFGVCSSGAELGFGSAEEGAAGSVEDALAPLLDAFSNFRLEVRSAAKGGEAAAAIMTACDDVRDNVLPELGVRLEDQGETAVWKLDDPEVLRKEREQKEMEILRKKQEKEAAAIAKAEKEASALIPPAEWFRTMKTEDGNNKYSAFDEDGVPTQDDKGEPLTKSSMKSLKKEWERQKKVHEKAIAKGAAS